MKIIDRKTGKLFNEDVWGKAAINALYGKSFFAKTLGKLLLSGISRPPLFSKLWGMYHDSSYSKKLINPFIERFSINMTECEKKNYSSFNDFFTRRLKKEARPQNLDDRIITCPADARYSFFLNLQEDFIVKGECFCLEKLLQNDQLATLYKNGSMVLGRLAPVDCHRFYFPCKGVASKTSSIPGPLFSVNPVATKDNPWIFWTNKRALTLLETSHFGTVAFLEIGATNCGSIIQTFTPGPVEKGKEKGFFQLGASAIILLFEQGTFSLSEDLKNLSSYGLEIFCQIGLPLGSCP